MKPENADRHPSRIPIAWMICAILLANTVRTGAQDAEPPSAQGNASLSGKVTGPDGAVTGAVVHVYHLSTETTFHSVATGTNGQFRIEGLPFGYYDVAVETPEGLYVADLVRGH